MLLATACPRSPHKTPTADTGTVSKPEKRPPDIPQRGPLAQRIHYEQAKSLLRAGRPADAVEVFRRAIDADPKGEMVANCYLGLGSALGELKRARQAVEAYSKVVELLPRDPEAYRALAIGQEEAGQLSEAQLSLQQALALDPDQLSAYQDLAALYLKQKDDEGAKKSYLQYELRRTYLIKTLGLSKDEQARVNAARALGDARDEATAKALGLALTDRSRAVRLSVIRALGQQALSQGTGPLKALLDKTTDPEEKRAIQLSLDIIHKAAQPGPQPEPKLQGKTKKP